MFLALRVLKFNDLTMRCSLLFDRLKVQKKTNVIYKPNAFFENIQFQCVANI